MIHTKHAADRTRGAAGVVLALAFFLGLAFEEIYKLDERAIPGGIRTFPLIALSSAMLYLIEPHQALRECLNCRPASLPPPL